jgi:hypothetical protein
MKALDQINRRLGVKKLKLASQDLARTWKMRQEKLSKRYTTNWNEITYHNGRFIAVRAGSNGAAFSTNGGQTWTATTLPGSNLQWQTVSGGTIDNIDYFVALASGSTTGVQDGING